MANHVHLIISAKEGYMLSSILRDFKKYTSVKITHAIERNCSGNRWKRMLSTFKEAGRINVKNKNYQFWQQDNHPKELTENEMMDQKLEYIHINPVVKSIVENPEDYLYSSAKDYAGKKGLLEIEFLE